jgi:predicted deacylase
MAGFFEPNVQLGDHVEVGDPLGAISDVLGEETVTVRTSQRGVVLVLRTFSRVSQGESLAVILETDLRTPT